MARWHFSLLVGTFWLSKLHAQDSVGTKSCLGRASGCEQLFFGRAELLIELVVFQSHMPSLAAIPHRMQRISSDFRRACEDVWVLPLLFFCTMSWKIKTTREMPRPGSNRGPSGLGSEAPPTELSQRQCFLLDANLCPVTQARLANSVAKPPLKKLGRSTLRLLILFGPAPCSSTTSARASGACCE